MTNEQIYKFEDYLKFVGQHHILQGLSYEDKVRLAEEYFWIKRYRFDKRREKDVLQECLDNIF